VSSISFISTLFPMAHSRSTKQVFEIKSAIFLSVSQQILI